MLTSIDVSALVYAVSDPELSYTQNKTPVVNFAVAANRKWKEQGGTEHEESCFIDCTAWAGLAEAITKCVHKGSPLYIIGTLKQERWEKDGTKHSKHALTVNRCVFLEQKDSGGNGRSSARR